MPFYRFALCLAGFAGIHASFHVCHCHAIFAVCLVGFAASHACFTCSNAKLLNPKTKRSVRLSDKVSDPKTKRSVRLSDKASNPKTITEPSHN